GTVLFNATLTQIVSRAGEMILVSRAGEFRTKFIINCAGLHSDRIARMAGAKLTTAIVPFRGEYYEVVASKHHLVRGLIYPVPDPRFPFLGVHFTPRIHGGIEAGPNAVLALKREGYQWKTVSLRDTLEILTHRGFWRMASKYWASGLAEMYRSLSKKSFTRALQKLLPELTAEDIRPAGAGVRAQAVTSDGSLVDDFCFVPSEKAIHVINVPSPAATASLKIAEEVVRLLPESVRREIAPTCKTSR